MVLARQATVHYGSNKAIPWRDLQDAIEILCYDTAVLKPRIKRYFQMACSEDDWDREPSRIDARIFVDITSNLVRQPQFGLEDLSYSSLSLVLSLRGFECTDPRDKVYSMLGILGSMGQRAYQDLVPDYSKDVFEVYRDFVKCIVTDTKSLDILCLDWAPSNHMKTEAGVSELPSWIPDWRGHAFSMQQQEWEDHKISETLLDPTGKVRYHASGKGFSKRHAVVRWPHEHAYQSLNRRFLEDVNRDRSIVVTGVAVGSIVFCTESFSDGIITKSALERLGGPFKAKSQDVTELPEQLWRTLIADRGREGMQSSSLYRRACGYILRKLSRNGHINIDKLLHRETGYVKEYLERVRAVTWNRSFIEGVLNHSFISASGKLVGLGPPTVRENDLIVVLYGCSVPFILRKVRGKASAPDVYSLVGEAFVYGLMDGQALDLGFEETAFTLV